MPFVEVLVLRLSLLFTNFFQNRDGDLVGDQGEQVGSWFIASLVREVTSRTQRPPEVRVSRCSRKLQADVVERGYDTGAPSERSTLQVDWRAEGR